MRFSFMSNVPKPLKITASWDPEAKVYWAESEDIPGLVTEAATMDELMDNVVALIPDLMELNSRKDGEVPIELVASRMVRLHAV